MKRAFTRFLPFGFVVLPGLALAIAAAAAYSPAEPVCVEQGAFCGHAAGRFRELEGRKTRVSSSLARAHAGAPRDRAEARRIERASLREVGWSRRDLGARVEVVRRALIRAVERQRAFSMADRSEMLKRLRSVPVRLPSESVGSPFPGICGEENLDLNATSALAPKSDPEVLLCTGYLLALDRGPGPSRASALDGVIAHEMGHQVGPEAMAGRSDASYAAFRACQSRVAGQALSDAQFEEAVADFWAAETLAELYEGLPASETRRHVVAAQEHQCDQETDPEEPVSIFRSMVTEREDTHLPPARRQWIGFALHPRLRKAMGCGVFSRAMPGCGLD